MSNVGLSQVNFDVGLQDDEEQQLEKEDEERERELHELLSKELTDDFSDDGNLSFSSQVLDASTHGHTAPEFGHQSYQQHHAGDEQDQEEPRGARYYEHPHPSLTRRGEGSNERSGFSSGDGGVLPPGSYPQGAYPEGTLPREYNTGVENRRYEQSAPGSGTEFRQADDYHGNTVVYHSNEGGFHGDNDDYRGNGGYPYHGGHGYQNDDVANVEDARESKYDDDYNGYYGDRDDDDDDSSHSNKHEAVQSGYTARDENFNTYKVQYTRSAENGGEVFNSAQGSETSGGREGPGSELAQLRVLYDARARKLEEVTREMTTKEKEYERQIRLLNHHLALGKGEREGLSCSLKHVQEVATERKNECEKLETKLQESRVEMEQILTEQHQSQSELEAAKKTIESLHQQLLELEKSESLTRAREQHENIVMATRKRYEDEVVRLKQKLDDVNNSLVWKNEESKRLHDELSQTRTETDRLRLDRAETVNRLTRSLEQSQKQNEDLLKSGSTQEISQLQNELLRSQRGNEELLQHYKTMEHDLTDLKEQLRIHESVTKLGLSVKTVSPPNTQKIKRNFAADDWKTPRPNSTSSNHGTDETFSGLQKELENSLAINKSKREEIEALRSKLDVLEKDLTNHKNEKQRTDLVIQNLQKTILEEEKRISELGELTDDPEKKMQYYETELSNLNALVQESRFKLEQNAERQNELEGLNLNLKSQMSEMVREHDLDKQNSVEQCRQSCLEFHDQAMKTMKEQLNQEFEEELSKIRSELEAVTLELDRAKESYVALSEDTRWLEKQTREHCQDENKIKIEELKAEWIKDKDLEIETLRQNIVTEMERNFGKEKASWKKTEDELTQQKVQTELVLAKMDWEKEKQHVLQEAVNLAVADAEKEFKHGGTERQSWEETLTEMKEKWEQEKQNEINKNLEQTRSEIENKLKSDHEKTLRVARQEWERAKLAEVEQEVGKAREDWDKGLEKLISEATASSVAAAKADWTKEQAEIRHNVMTRAVDEALASAKEEWEQEKRNMDLRVEDLLRSEKEKWQATADEQRMRAIDTALLLAEQKWRSDHEDKTSEAVKEALETVRETWQKERNTAIETAVSQSLHSAKEAWNENKLREIEHVLSAARKQWLTEFDVLKVNTSTSPTTGSFANNSADDTNKAFTYLEAQYSKNLKEFRETELKKIFEECERKQAIALKEQEEKHQKQLEAIAKISQEDWDREFKELETAYQDKLQAIVNEMEEKWNEKTASLEADWSEKLEQEQTQLEQSYRTKFQHGREDLGRELREKYEKRFEHARKKLENQYQERFQSAVERAKHDWEEEQEEDRVALEEQHLKKLATEGERVRKELTQETEKTLSKLKEDSDTARLHLQAQCEKEKQYYVNEIVKLQKQLTEAQQEPEQDKRRAIEARSCQTEKVGENTWISMSELVEHETNTSKLHELRRQYLATTAQLKEDLQYHVMQTRKNAAKAIRSEVMKERHATAKRLRKYYLECLKELLDNDKTATGNNQTLKSDEEKLKIMGERLKISEERQDTLKSPESTLTNVTALADGEPTISETTQSSKPSTLRSNEQREAPRDRTYSRTRSPPRTLATTDSRQVQSSGDDRGIVPHSTFTQETSASDPGVRIPYGDKDSRGTPPGYNSRGLRLASSTESLFLFETENELQQLPPVIPCRQQELPAHLVRPAVFSESSDTSSSSSAGRTGASLKNKSGAGKTGATLKNVSTRDRSRGKTKRDAGNTHARERDARLTKDEQGEKTLFSRNEFVFSRLVTSPARTQAVSELPTKLTSSLSKPITDVLPSKPLSPSIRVPHKFAYTLHAKKEK